MTLAAVARDEYGAFLGASAVVMEGVSDPDTVEAMAVREGLALARDLLGQSLRIATDCANVVRHMSGQGMGLYGHIIREIKADMASFMAAEVIHESRNSNVDAHLLARSSIYASVGKHVWFLSPHHGVCTSYSDS